MSPVGLVWLQEPHWSHSHSDTAWIAGEYATASIVGEAQSDSLSPCIFRTLLSGSGPSAGTISPESPCDLENLTQQPVEVSLN